MLTIVGLGNPGEEYVGTRHNAGRNVLLTLAKKEKLGEWEEDRKLKALVLKTTAARFVLPNTFMNKSGDTMRALHPKTKDLLVIHDDADLPLGRMKFSFGKRSGGHRGVESVIRALKTNEFWRLRIGIQKKNRVDAMKIVLMKYAPTEKALAEKTMKRAAEAVRTFLDESPEKAMTTFNT